VPVRFRPEAPFTQTEFSRKPGSAFMALPGFFYVDFMLNSDLRMTTSGKKSSDLTVYDGCQASCRVGSR
jgi:hypothetical protein